ncbi:thioesterase domain-containing protein [Longispora sp. K20-0274]|uniref:thioesterase domain-containing protein n=1 Tax=Longispora sp. K20-0274 TaxID=3088255 RepID=UPI00399C3F19
MTVSHEEATSVFTAIWADLLGVPAGPGDNFFDLGGYSLLVVDVVERARAAGLRIRALDVFEQPTAEALARVALGGADPGFRPDMVGHVWRTSASPWDAPPSLVPLVPDGDREPLFVVHLGTGHVRLFTALAEQVRCGRPVHGFEAIGYRARVRPFLSIGETADRYLEELRAAQPVGPYHLAGLCAGGVIALEMAQRLRAAGEEVAALVLVDLPFGMPELDPGWGLNEHFEYMLGALRVQFGLHDPVADLPGVLAELQRRVWFEDTDRAEDFYRLVVLWAAAQYSQEHYEPRPYTGPVTVVSAAEHVDRARAYWAPTLPGAEYCVTDDVRMTHLLREPGVADAFVKALT